MLKTVTTQKVLDLLEANSNLPFYVFCQTDMCDIMDVCLETIYAISIEYINTELDDERCYIKSEDDEELIEKWVEQKHNEVGEEEFYKHSLDDWYEYAENWFDNIEWEKCVLARAAP